MASPLVVVGVPSNCAGLQVSSRSAVTPEANEVWVDLGDLPLVVGRSWVAAMSPKSTRLYAVSASRRSISMHRVILGLTDPEIWVDHRNGNGLDNRRSNFRIVTPAQNAQNRAKHVSYAGGDPTSRYRGVSWHARRCKWQAFLWNGKRNLALGTFNVEKEAALAYDAAAREHFGPYARLNFPDSVEQSA